jgi:hypothetical protein
VIPGTSIDIVSVSMKPNESEMKAGKNMKKWTEPLTYVVLVAAFGFLSTEVTHSRSEDPVQDKDLVSYTMENELDAMINMVKENKEVSL